MNRTNKQRRTLSALAFGLAMWINNPSAQSEPPSSVVPDGGFQFSGDWNCEGSFRNGRTHRSTFHGAAILDGKWLELTEQDVEPNTGFKAKYLIGYDTETKRFIEFDANNFGSAEYSSELGWQNDVLTMTSAVSQAAKVPYVANRFIYTIAGNDSFSIDWQVSRTSPLNWEASDHLVCKRARALATFPIA